MTLLPIIFVFLFNLTLDNFPICDIFFLFDRQPWVTLRTVRNAFLMCVHLFAVNSEFVVQAKTRVFMLWSSLIFMLHIDGVHHATKKNWLVSTICICYPTNI